MQIKKQYLLKTEEEFQKDIEKALQTKTTVKYLNGEINCYTDNNMKLQPKENVNKKLSEIYEMEVRDIRYKSGDEKEIYIICQETADEETIYWEKEKEYDTEDVLSVISEEFDIEKLSDDQYKEFLEKINIEGIVDKYETKRDANFGIWDNIRAVIDCYYREEIEEAIQEITKK